MTKRRLTKKQEAEMRKERVREESLRRKLQKELAPKSKEEVVIITIPTYEYDDPVQARSIPSAKAAKRKTQPSRIRDYSDNPELAAREALAQKEKERKKTRIAPAYSKGAYQYITDGMDPSELGRKL